MAVIGGTPSPLAANLLCIAENDKHLLRLKTANLHESGIGPKPTWLIGSPTSGSRGRADLASTGWKRLQMSHRRHHPSGIPAMRMPS